MNLLILILGFDIWDNLKEIFRLMLSQNNPLYYSLIAAIFIFGFTIMFYKYIYAPTKERLNSEKESLELKNAKLMALFAELDPDPIIRVDHNGKIIQTNDSAVKISNRKNLKGKTISEVFPFIKVNFVDLIEDNQSTSFQEKIGEGYYSILIRGNAFLGIAQLYFRDVTKRQTYESKLMESQSQLKELSNHLQNLLEDERHRIARELHDGIGQNLSLIRLNLSKLSDKLSTTEEAKNISNIIESLEITIQELKELSYRLKPKILEEMGLGPALFALVDKISKDFSIEGSIDISGKEIRLDYKIETYLYRVVQESINNIIKHSRATEFNIQLIIIDNIIRMIITDNGRGIDLDKLNKKEASKRGMGILNIQERIKSYNGNLKIDSSPNKGTILIIEIPLQQN
jgi:signal transduction histidine kinase